MTTYVRDEVLEEWLTEHDIAWELDPALPIDQVDHLAGLANQARHQTLDDDTVDRYTADLEAGATFPPIIVRSIGADRWAPVGGNHRLAAYRRAGRTRIPAYTIQKISDVDIRLLAVEDNRRHGLPLTDAERVDHALHLFDHEGWTLAAAARACGISLPKLIYNRSARRARERAADNLIEGVDKLSATSLAKLDALTDDLAFQVAARAMVDGHILASEIQHVVGKANNSADPLRYITDLVQAARQRTRRKPGHPVSAARAPRIRLLHDLEGIVATYTLDDVIADTTTPLHRQQLADQIAATAGFLHRLHRRIQPEAYRPKGAA